MIIFNIALWSYKIFESLQEVTVSNFFAVKLIWNPPFSTRMNKEEIKRKRIFQEVIITAEGSQLVLQTKIAYSDLLKTPKYLLCFVFVISGF